MSSRAKREIGKLGIDIVSGCQLRCLGCPNSTGASGPVHEMDALDLRRALVNIDIPVTLLRLYNFGEPLLHSDLRGIASALSSWCPKGCVVELSTNAQVPVNKDIEWFIKESGIVDRLVVSADGDGTRAEYERLRPPAKWKRLTAFLEAMRDTPAGLEKIVRVCLPEVTLQWDKVKLRWVFGLERYGFEPHFREYHPFPRSKQNLSGQQRREIPKGSCAYVRGKNMYVNSRGEVTPCCVHPKPFVIGSLLEEPASKLMKRKRRLIKGMDHYRFSSICRECQFT